MNKFQASVRKRESMRLKLQMNSAPGVLEKELRSKINVEESVCEVRNKRIRDSIFQHFIFCFPGYCQVPERL